MTDAGRSRARTPRTGSTRVTMASHARLLMLTLALLLGCRGGTAAGIGAYCEASSDCTSELCHESRCTVRCSADDECPGTLLCRERAGLLVCTFPGESGSGGSATGTGGTGGRTEAGAGGNGTGGDAGSGGEVGAGGASGGSSAGSGGGAGGASGGSSAGSGGGVGEAGSTGAGGAGEAGSAGTGGQSAVLLARVTVEGFDGGAARLYQHPDWSEPRAVNQVEANGIAAFEWSPADSGVFLIVAEDPDVSTRQIHTLFEAEDLGDDAVLLSALSEIHYQRLRFLLGQASSTELVRQESARIAQHLLADDLTGDRAVDLADVAAFDDAEHAPLLLGAPELWASGRAALTAGVSLSEEARRLTDPELLSVSSTASLSGIALGASHLVLAEGAAGIEVVDIKRPRLPGEPAPLALVGARHVSARGNEAYVAAGANGLHRIALEGPEAPNVLETLPIAAGATEVLATDDGVVVLDGAASVSVFGPELASGPLASWTAPHELQALAQKDDYVFVAGVDELTVLQHQGDALTPVHNVEWGSSGPSFRARLALDGDTLYAAVTTWTRAGMFDVNVFGFLRSIDVSVPEQASLNLEKATRGNVRGLAAGNGSFYASDASSNLLAYATGAEAGYPRAKLLTGVVEAGIAHNGELVFVADPARGVRVVDVRPDHAISDSLLRVDRVSATVTDGNVAFSASATGGFQTSRLTQGSLQALDADRPSYVWNSMTYTGSLALDVAVRGLDAFVVFGVVTGSPPWGALVHYDVTLPGSVQPLGSYESPTARGVALLGDDHLVLLETEVVVLEHLGDGEFSEVGVLSVEAQALAVWGTSAYLLADGDLYVSDLSSPEAPGSPALVAEQPLGAVAHITTQDQTLIVTSDQGATLYDLTDSLNPELLISLPLPDARRALLDSGRVYLADTVGHVVAFDLSSGAELGNMRAPSPVLDMDRLNDRLLLSTETGMLSVMPVGAPSP